jgi:hypothetical protein
MAGKRKNPPNIALKLWQMSLLRFSADPSARLSDLSSECHRAFPAECRMAASWIVEPVNVFKCGDLSLPPHFP